MHLKTLLNIFIQADSNCLMYYKHSDEISIESNWRFFTITSGKTKTGKIVLFTSVLLRENTY